MKKTLLMSLALVIVLSAMLLAGSEDRIGTAGAQELRIPIGSRGSAMGGALVANAKGTEALFWNPAGAVAVGGTEAMFSHLQYFADMKLEYAAVKTNVEGFGTIGFSAKVLSVGDILKTTFDDAQGEAGEYFNPTFSVIGLTYARQLTDRVAFGATGCFINERIEQVTARGLAFDFGFTYVPNWRGLKFGVVVKNFGPEMKFDGPNFDNSVIPTGSDPNSAAKDLRSQSASFELPSSVQFGVAWSPLDRPNEKNNVEFSTVFQSNNFSQDEFRGGFEYGYNDMFFLRGGYAGSNQSDYMFGPSFGAGVQMKWGATKVMFDYSWQKTDFFTGDNQYFTVKLGF
jgi:hypothetical protein